MSRMSEIYLEIEDAIAVLDKYSNLTFAEEHVEKLSAVTGAIVAFYEMESLEIPEPEQDDEIDYTDLFMLQGVSCEEDAQEVFETVGSP